MRILKEFKSLIFLFGMLFFILPFCRAVCEVQQVILKWPPGLCQTSCERGLEQQFRNTRGITDVRVDGTTGQAFLRWDSKVPFSYRSIESALARIGLGLDDIFVTVRGNVTQGRGTMLLTSIGDNTQFLLMSPPEIVPNRHIELNSPFNRELTPQVRSLLMEAERNHQVVTITGPLFQPETSPPLFLTIEVLKGLEKNKLNDWTAPKPRG